MEFKTAVYRRVLGDAFDALAKSGHVMLETKTNKVICKYKARLGQTNYNVRK